MAAKRPYWNFGFRYSPDMKTMRDDVREESRLFGETMREATCRLGLMCARELAGDTQAFGKSWRKTLSIQKGAIVTDMAKIFIKTPPGKGVIDDAATAIRIMEKYRSKRGKRTEELKLKLRITEGAFMGAMATKFRLANMAKAAWIGSARPFERKEGKGQQIRFGKAYTPYLKKWEKEGRGRLMASLFKTTLEMHNTIKHVADPYVLRTATSTRALYSAAGKTLKWYEKATTANLAKNKPKT